MTLKRAAFYPPALLLIHASLASGQPTLKLVAGLGMLNQFGDGGPAVGAYIGNADAIALDPAGNLYIKVTGTVCRQTTAILKFFQFADVADRVLMMPAGSLCGPCRTACPIYCRTAVKERQRGSDCVLPFWKPTARSLCEIQEPVPPEKGL